MAESDADLRAAIRTAAQQAFDEVRRANPNEQFYAFALYSDEDLVTVVPAANSEEGYARTVKRYGYTEPADQACLRWGTAEWAYEAAGGDHFNDICKRLYEESKSVKGDAAFRTQADRVIGSMVEALRELDQAGYFGAGPDRERVTLFVTVSDSDGAEKIENESAKQLNPPAVAKAFRKRYRA